MKRWVDWGGVGDEGEEVEGVALSEGRVGGQRRVLKKGAFVLHLLNKAWQTKRMQWLCRHKSGSIDSAVRTAIELKNSDQRRHEEGGGCIYFIFCML